MDFENLYILVLVAVGLYRVWNTFVKKKKENEGKQPSSESQTRTEPVVDEYEYETVEEEPEANYRESKSVEDFLETLADRYNRPNQDSSPPVTFEEEEVEEIEVVEKLDEKEPESEVTFEAFDPYSLDEEDDDEGFDARQAIIYKAILDRPYQ